MFRSWWQRAFVSPLGRTARRRGARPPARLLGRTTRLSMTALEDRITPAVNSTFNAGTGALVLTFTGTNNDAITIQSQNTAANDFKVNAAAGTTLDGVAGNSETFTGVTSITVNGSAATGETVTFDTNSQNSVLTGAASLTNIDVTSLTDSTGTGSLQAASFSEGGGANATTTLGRPLLTTGAAGVSITGDTTITANSTVDATAAATGGITLTAAQSITVNSGASVKTSGGGITLSANQQATPTSGNFVGINVAGATITSATGAILLRGKGGDTGSLNVGVLLQAGAVVSSTGTGAGAATVTLNGTGGTGTDQQVGVLVVGTGSLVTSVDGAVSVAGAGGAGSADRNFGVWVINGGQVASTGTTGTAATVTIQGTGGSGTDQMDGVTIEGVGSLVTSVAGTVGITGTGGTGSGNRSVGVAVINGGQVSSTGTGASAATVTVQGTGGAGTSFEEGVVVNGGSALVTSKDGAIQITGTAGSGAPSFAIDLSNTGQVTSTGTANVTLTGDSMTFDPTAAINAGTNVVTLRPKTAGTAISLGGADAAGTLGLSNAELSRITAGTLVIGRADSAGNITVTAPVAASVGTTTLTLTTAGSILDGTATEQTDITAPTLNLNAGVAIGSAAAGGNLDVNATTLNAGRVGAAAGILVNVNDTLGGVAVGLIDAGSGNATLTSAGGPITSVTPNDNVPEVIGNVVTLDASASPQNGNTGQIGFFTTGAQFFEVAANVLTALTNNSRMWVADVAGGGGAGGTPNVQIGAVNAGSNTAFLRLNGGTMTSQTVDGTADVTADTVNLSTTAAGGTLGTSAASPLEINATTLRAATTGTGGGIHIRDTAGGVTVALASAVNGDVDLEAAGAAANLTTANPGAPATAAISAPGHTVSLRATGAVVSTTSLNFTDVAATSLAVTAQTGIGSAANPLRTAVTNLAFLNNATNVAPPAAPTANNPAVGSAVNIANVGALTVTSVAGLAQSANLGTAAGATTTLRAASPFTFAVNTTSAGTLTATAAETNDPGVFADKLTVNAGVTVESTGGDVVLQAGDDAVLNAGALVKADVGSVTLTAASGDLDNEGGISMGTGSIQAGANVSLTARDDITVSTISANAATGTVTITSTAGNIVDDGDDTTLISGNALSLSAVRAIGQPGATPDIDSAVNTLSAATTGAGPFAGAPTPGIWVTDTDAVTVTSATTQDGNIVLTAGGTMTANTVTAHNVAGGAARNVLLLTTAGDILLGAVSAVGPNPSNVRLTAAGAIIDNNGAATNVTAAGLAAQAANGIGSADSLETAVSNFAATNSTAGNIAVVNTGALTVTSVGPVVGVTVTGVTNTAPGGAVTVTAQSPLTVAANVTAAGTITLTAAETNDPGTFADKLTVNAGVTVQSTAADVILRAGDDVVVNGTVRGTNIDLVSGFADADNEGVITLNGTVAATATVALNVNSSNTALPTGTNVATEAAGATITAAGLLLLNSPVGAPGPFSLDASTTNAVGTIAANTQAGVNYRDSAALTVGSVNSPPEGVTGNGILTSNHDVTLCTITGDISLTQGLNAGTGTARLASAGAVTQGAAGKITAANLGVTATGNITLDQATPTNHVTGTVALNTGGTIRFQDDSAFTVGTVAASGCFGGATGIGGTDVTICSPGDVTLTSPVAAAGGTARIQAGGNVTQTATGTITAVNLGVRADGNIDLCVPGAPNAVTGVFAADASGGPAGSFVHFLDGSGYAVGTVTAFSCFTADAVGVKSNNGTIDLVNTAGSVTLLQPVNAGTGTVRLNSAGAVTQTPGGAGAVTAANLAVVAAGNVDLCQVANTVTGNFAASDTAAGAFVRFLDTAGFTVGAVAADACAAGATGVTTTNSAAAPFTNDIDLVSQAGPLTLAQAVNAGSATVRLNSGGAITQTAAGVITAANLAARGTGTVNLCTAANVVPGVFAAVGGLVAFNDTAGFTVGTVAGDVCALGATGVTAGGDADLVSGGSIVLAQPVNAGGNTVRINANGSVTQTPGGAGAVTAQNLAVVAAGNVDLCQVANTVSGNFAASDTAPGAFIRFLDTAGFTVGAVAVDACAAGATGVVTANGDIDLVSTAGPVTLAQVVTAGTATVRINSGTDVTQAATGVITATNLAVRGNGTINLCTAPNAVPGTFAAFNAGGLVAFNDTAGFTVGTVADDVCARGATGVTAGGDADLVSGGSIVLAQPVNAGGGTVRINANGSVTQTPGGAGAITAQNLAVRANGNVDLCQVANTVPGTFAAFDAAAGAFIRFLDTAGFTVGTVASDLCAAGATGVATTNGDISLVSQAGPITLAQLVNAGTATVRLNSGAAITQTPGGAGAMTATDLAVVAAGNVDLCQVANNVSGAFAASDTGPGASVLFLNGPAITVGAVTGDVCAAGATGVVTNNGNVELRSTAGPVSLTQVVDTAPTGGGASTATVRINSGAGVSQTAAGVITAQNLAVRANGAVDLTPANNLVGTPAVPGTFAAVDTALAAAVRFRDTAGGELRVGTVTNGPCALGATGVTTNDGDVTIRNAALLTVSETLNLLAPIAAGTGTVRLQAGGNVVQDPNPVGGPAAGPATDGAAATAGPISAAALAVRTTVGDIELDRDDFISVLGPPGRFAAVVGTGHTINFRDTAGLILDTVAADPTPGLFDAVVGVTAQPLLTPGGPVGGAVRLHTGGGLTQTTAGPVTTNALGVRNTTSGDVNLTTATNYTTGTGNLAPTFAGFNSAPGGRVDFATLGALTLGTVPADGTFLQTRGITASNGGSNLRSGTDFIARDNNFTAGNEFVRLGTGEFLVNPGQTFAALGQVNSQDTVVFDAGIAAGKARFGVPAAGDASPNGLAGGPPATGTQVPNIAREGFTDIRPSETTPFFVNGNLPTTFPGDALALDLAGITGLTFVTDPGQGNGHFTFTNRQPLVFSSIERLPQASLLAISVQTGPKTFKIVVQGRFGAVNAGSPGTIPNPSSNPFIVSPALVNPAQPFGAPRLAVADVNGDGVPDLIVGNGPAGPPVVTVLDGSTLFSLPAGANANPATLAQFFAYDPRFQGGLFVAGGDLVTAATGLPPFGTAGASPNQQDVPGADGRAEIITGADAGGGPNVRTFLYTGPTNGAPANPANSVRLIGTAAAPNPLANFFAYGAAFTGGVRVATGDVNGDGVADIVTGAGPGGGPHVKVYDGRTGAVIRSFFAYDAAFHGGVYVGAGDYGSTIPNGVSTQPPPLLGTPVFLRDGLADIITGAGAGGGPHVKVFDGATNGVLASFMAFGPDGTTSLFGADLGVSTGVGSVSMGDVNGDGIPDILVSSYRGPRTRIAAFLGNSQNPPRYHFTPATNPDPTLFGFAGDGDLVIPSLRDGAWIAGFFGG